MAGNNGKYLGHTKDPRYNSQRWLKLRRSILAGKPRCALCGHANANSLDHIIPVEHLTSDAEFFARENLQPLHGGRLNVCTICSAASGGVIQGDCQSVKAANTMDVARKRLFRRTGLQWGQMPMTVARPGADPAESVSEPPRNWPYPTVQAAAEDLRPLADGTSDYRLVRDMIDAGAPCDSTCDCGGQMATSNNSGAGRCIDAIYDLANEWTAA